MQEIEKMVTVKGKKADTVLRTSCLQQETSQTKGKFPWVLFDKDGNQLWELPADIPDKHIEPITLFAKEFEQRAYHLGVKDASDAYKKEIEIMKNIYEVEMQRMREENDRVSTMLDKHLRETLEEDDEESKFGIPEYMR